ncbi:hypothetical protein NAT51_03520 [Flavobacterium amniphilum]|uniref:hypothetical protein n=1 Tax=Flavobacterium amniphilum TaxID=1834035 RepID=UPI002029D8B1|nr:hypothetical protein [Flavobacterium amniphilum]MCL9804575.1 hypothetical protein [Flavobacterium amniphilum]
MKSIVLLASFLFLFFSCKEHCEEPLESFDLYFENPQPVNDSELSKIPNRFIGSYLVDNDYYMIVSKNQIITKYLYKSMVHKKDLDSLRKDFIIEKNRMIFREDDKLILKYRFIGDSIELSNEEIDIFFEFSDKQKMKRLGNCLILNEKDSVFWKSKILRFEKKSAVIENLNNWSELYQFDSITKIKSKKIDSTKFILSPSRREFKKYLEISKQVQLNKET